MVRPVLFCLWVLWSPWCQLSCLSLSFTSVLSASKVQGLGEWEGFLPCLFLEWAFLLGLCGMEWGWGVNREDFLWGNWETHRGGGLDCEEPWKTALPVQAVQFSRLELSRLLPGGLACSWSQHSCVTSTLSVHPPLSTLLVTLLLLRLPLHAVVPPLQGRGFSLKLLPPHRCPEVCLKSLADYVKTHRVLFMTVGSFFVFLFQLDLGGGIRGKCV